jgi:hypothetical protein
MSKPYRTSDFLARRADAAAKAAKDAARAERLARARADIERTLAAARANAAGRSRLRASPWPVSPKGSASSWMSGMVVSRARTIRP